MSDSQLREQELLVSHVTLTFLKLQTANAVNYPILISDLSDSNFNQSNLKKYLFVSALGRSSQFTIYMFYLH